MDPENAIFAIAPLAYAIGGTALGAMLVARKKRAAGFSFAVTAFLAALYILFREDWDWGKSGYHKVAWLSLACSGAIIVYQIKSHLKER